MARAARSPRGAMGGLALSDTAHPVLAGEVARSTLPIVLAAGMGTRMRSDTAKVLHTVGGRPMVLRVLDVLRGLGFERAVLVTGRQAERVEAVLAGAESDLRPLAVQPVRQVPQGGTGHAVAVALEAVSVRPAQDVLVLYADAPMIDAAEVAGLVSDHARSGAAATLLTAEVADPSGYGRIVRASGRVQAIVEERDATPEQRRICEINTGVGCFRAEPLRAALLRCAPANAQGEVYLTDVVGLMVADGRAVGSRVAADAEAVLGINDRRALAAAEARLRRRTLDRLMYGGVTVVDPATTYVDERCTFGTDVRIEPMTVIEGACRFGSGCRLGPGAHVRDSEVADGAEVRLSVVEGSRVGPGCRIGPFSHLRPGTELDANVEVGNFAELKNARVGAGSKQHHHSYVGDADVGAGVNVGAGVVTVNYDGRRKHRTRVADGAFLGCNANLVAPLELGERAFVAAGSTLTESVPPEALAIARARQVNRPGWVRERMARETAGPAAGGASPLVGQGDRTAGGAAGAGAPAVQPESEGDR